MAEERKSRGGLSRVVLWLVILALFATVWWLASERNERQFRVATRLNQLVIERGRFFPIGTTPANDKMYAPVPVPQGEKTPPEVEFDDQNALDRWLFDTLGGWAKSAAKRGDTHAAAALVDRASQLPGLTGAQISELTSLRADLAWDDAQADIVNAAAFLDAARRKLETVRANNGTHAADATQLSGKLDAAQKNVRELVKK